MAQSFHCNNRNLQVATAQLLVKTASRAWLYSSAGAAVRNLCKCKDMAKWACAHVTSAGLTALLRVANGAAHSVPGTPSAKAELYR